jgi:16S rRNA (cytosine967-C5)-methyltransferase
VLIDAPCSGTGTIRHNPEIRWSLMAGDIAELAEKQTAILANAAKTVKKGGRIIYSTCSLEEEENEKVIEAFLAANKEFEVSEPDAPEHLITGRGFVRTFPQRDNTDGFFAAVLKKQF